MLAANSNLSIVLVVIAAGAGALLGDNTTYAIGHSGLRRVADRLMKRSEKSRRSLEWGHEQLERRGVWIVVVARFIPGGRTATIYVAGTVDMPWKRRFLPATVVAAVIWSLYASALGCLGGAAFENNLWLPMLIAGGMLLLFGGVGELVRRKVLDRDSDDKRKDDAADDGSAEQRRAPRPEADRAPAAIAAGDAGSRQDRRRRSTG